MAIYYRKVIAFICLILFVGVFIGQASSFAASNATRRILFISSYHESFETVPKQIQGIKEALDGTGTLLDIDYMDSKRVDTKENYINYLNFLKYRLQKEPKYDAVLVGDDNALQFVMDHRDELFATTPVIFFCVNDTERAAMASKMALTTGIVEGISLKDNLELSQKLFPKAKTIYGIVDNTKTGHGDANSFMASARLYPSQSFKLINASEHSTQGLKEALSLIEENSIVFYMSLFEDGEGQSYTISDGVSLINDYVKAPVFRMSIGGVGEGLLGGNMVSYEGQGRMAAEMALKVLNGTNIESIDMIPQSPNLNVFDYQIMKKFGLKISDLPRDSKVLNAPKDYFQTYKNVLIPAIVIVLFLIAVVAILLNDIRKLRQKDRELELANEELTALYEEMTASEEELRYQYEQLNISQEALHLSEERYKTLAYTDALTGLSNRPALLEFLDQFTKVPNRSWQLLYLDLDNFKFINDSKGHSTGDELLKQLSIRFKNSPLPIHFLSRLGGDEFVIIMDTFNNAVKLNEALVELMRIVEKVIVIDNFEFYVTCSMGVSTFPKDGTSGDILLRKADMAMYQAKQNGRNKFECYNQTIENVLSEKMAIQTQIRTALNNEEFYVVFQPQYDLRHRKLLGVEVLTRWKTVEGELISPEAFIPVAEEQGLIRDLGKWVYTESFKMALEWERLKSEPLHISVNVSVKELNEAQYASTLIQAIKDYGLSVNQVAVEITESILIDSRGQAIAQLEMLRKAGIEIQLDDFGTGYSSLNYLLQLPLDTIKIDRGFIKDILENKYYEEMAKSIIDMAHRLGLKVIAEGVENEAQLSMLKNMSCDAIQGYYYSRPISAEDLKTFNYQGIEL